MQARLAASPNIAPAMTVAGPSSGRAMGSPAISIDGPGVRPGGKGKRRATPVFTDSEDESD